MFPRIIRIFDLFNFYSRSNLFFCNMNEFTEKSRIWPIIFEIVVLFDLTNRRLRMCENARTCLEEVYSELGPLNVTDALQAQLILRRDCAASKNFENVRTLSWIYNKYNREELRLKQEYRFKFKNANGLLLKANVTILPSTIWSCTNNY